jgi:osmotically-inducible protein OsmY
MHNEGEKMIISEDNSEQLSRTDDDILVDIWDALWKKDAIHFKNMGSVSTKVKHGEVSLYGHLSQGNNLPLIESITQSIPGVVEVHNYLVLDRE